MTCSLANLAASVGGGEIEGDGNVEISDIQYDSRLVTPGCLFAALRGGYVDGHDFVQGAIERGAAALLVDRELGHALPSLRVPDTRAALSPLAARYFGHPSKKLGVIGITGTDGKTTTSYLTDAILGSAGATTGLIGTVSVKIADEIVQHETRQTTPESLEIQRLLRQMVDAGVEWAVLEATSHGLAQHRLDDVAFDIAAVTNITHEHLEFHKTIENYRAAKASLFDRVSESGGRAVVNLDDEGARAVIPHAAGASLLTYSTSSAAAGLRAERIRIGVGGTTFGVCYDGSTVPCESPLIGGFNVENALCAIGIAISAGLELDQIAAGLRTAPPIPGRMERVDEGQPFSVIVDYAHTPDSLQKLLTLLRQLSPKSRIIAVSGSAGERDVPKRALQGAVSARLADFSIFTTEDPRFEDAAAIIDQIAEGAAGTGARSGRDYSTVVDRTEAIAAAIDRAQPGDIVLLAGKGHERSIIWGSDKLSWNEPEIARCLLRERGYSREA
ncbi:MAG TPA: UDP-N-acetylmuramoyl-L-alanyl-D-glutamate--2,6-diaminopimelate ligase [Thermomicrobiales bacterium]|nr:UDP-N-acetylmuramoyl-L-alanyl-D-glutamate--2,6-diaminopimelate ligase [Thermomicrobiales bacterium]